MKRSTFELRFRLFPKPLIMFKSWVFLRVYFRPSVKFETYTEDPGGGGTLGIPGWGCAAGTLEPLTYGTVEKGNLNA